MTDDPQTDQTKLHGEGSPPPNPAAEPAPEPSEAAEPAESALPPEVDAPDRPAPPAPPDPASATPEPGIQSKFGSPASTLGIRPRAATTAAPPAAPINAPPLPVSPPPAATTAATPAVFPPTPLVPSPPLQAAASRIPAVPTAIPAAVPKVPAEAADDDHVPTWAERFRQLSPALVILGIGSIGALIFLVFAMTSHTTPVAVLLSAGVVVTLAFAADAVIASIATWRAAVEDEDPGRAVLLAVVAGVSAIVSAGSLGAVTVLLLVLSGM